MKMKPIAVAAISGLVIALAGMPVMAEDIAPTGEAMQDVADNSQTSDNAQASDNAQSSDSSQGQNSNTGSGQNSDEGNPDTPSGDDY